MSICICINISESRARHGQSAILVLTLLVQYRKYESNNPYVVKLSILDQEMALHGYSQVYSSYCQTRVKNLIIDKEPCAYCKALVEYL